MKYMSNRNAVFVVLVSNLLGCSQEPPETTLNVPIIVISVDTLRSDRLPIYGYERIETPHISRLAADGIVFERAWSHVPLTLPSHASILTGLLPTRHGVRNNIGYRLDEGHLTLPAELRKKGYATGAAVSSWVLRGDTGLAAAFQHYDDAIPVDGSSPSSSERSGEATIAAATRWIDARGEDPFFFMLHLFEPHAPYAAPSPWSDTTPPYDGEIRWSDELVGRFLDHLRASGIYDRALIVFLSDHGEGLGDHGEPQHGIFLYREALQVPLVIKLPGSSRKGERIADPAALIDVFPTVARAVGIEVPPGRTGRDLLSPNGGSARSIYAESHYGRIHLGWSPLRSLIGERLHYIEAPRSELYDLLVDPAETTNILEVERRAAAAFREELASIPAGEESAAAIDPEAAARLEALGYLGGSSNAGEGALPDPKDGIGQIAALASASDLMNRGEHNDAVVVLSELVRKNPSFADAWGRMGTALESSGRLDEAYAAYRRAGQLSPVLAPELALSAASVLVRMGRLDEAEQHAQAGLAADPDGAHLLLARIRLARRDPSGAERELGAIRTPGAQARLVLAEVRASQGRLEEALEMINGATPVERREFLRGHVLTLMGRHAEAIGAFESEIAHFPSHRQAWGYLASLHFLEGRTAEGRAVLERMIEANPDRAALELGAKTLEQFGERETAAQWRDRANRRK